MRGKTLAAGTLCALVLVSAASGGSRASRVTLKLTINGAGTVLVRGDPPRFSDRRFNTLCRRSICHRSLHIKKGKYVTLVAKPGLFGKLGPWRGACTGTDPMCSLHMTRKRQVTATFVSPGAKTNPIPMQRSWSIGSGWTLKVAGVTPNADGQVIDNVSGMPAVPPPGAQFFMLELVLGYSGGGSSSLMPLAVNWSAEGSHNLKYGYFDDRGCGQSADVSLPAPDLQPMIHENQSVLSGHQVDGHICLQVASNDASTLLFNTGYPADVWFALN